MAKHTYIAKNAKGLKFRVTVSDKDVVVKFENGQFSTDDNDLAAEIDAALSGGIGRHARKADRSAALAMAAQHQAMMKRTGAQKGGVTAGAIKDSMNTAMQERDVQLQSEAGDHIKDKFADDENLVLTDPGLTAPSAGLGKQTGVVDVLAEPAPAPKLKLG